MGTTADQPGLDHAIARALVKAGVLADMMRDEAARVVGVCLAEDYLASHKVPIARISIEMIQMVVADYYALHPSVMKSKGRPYDIAQPRQIAMYLARQLTKKTLTQIGRAFRRDHGTVIHACTAVENRMATEAKVREDVETLTKRLTYESARG